MKIEVIDSLWGADGKEFAGGMHEIEKPSKAFLKLAAAAEAVGAIKVSASKEERSTMSSVIESQSESEKAYAKAQDSGDWHEGNLHARLAQDEHALYEALGADRDLLEARVDETRKLVEAVKSGKSYEEAVAEVKG